LEGFASFFGADFYGLPRNTSAVALHKKSTVVAAELPYADHALVPFRAGESVAWNIADA
jgi:dihydroorotase